MTILDIVNAPWAILEDRLTEIRAIHDRWVRGDDPDIGAIEARLGRPLVNQPQGYEVRDGAALVSLRGVLGPRMNMMAEISGGTSTELFARDIRAALEDSSVRSIVIMADTPGGAVAGTQSAAQVVMGARGIKPIATFAEGMIASAGVWIGTAADSVWLADGATQAGSVGVVATHTDVSRREEALGQKTTEIVAGAYKRAASQYGPLTEKGRETLQAQVDYLYELFVGDVAAQRGTSPEDVLERMADGRMFIGQQAVDAGLADGIVTLEELIANLNSRAASADRSIIVAPSSMDSPPMTPTQAAAQWAAENPEAAAMLRAEGAESERQRIAAVRQQAMPGHEALIERLAGDGTTTGPEAAVQVLAAERERQASAGAARMAEALQPVAFAPAPDQTLEAAPEAAADPSEDLASAVELGIRARQITDEARAQGRTMSASEAVAQAQRELTN